MKKSNLDNNIAILRMHTCQCAQLLACSQRLVQFGILEHHTLFFVRHREQEAVDAYIRGYFKRITVDIQMRQPASFASATISALALLDHWCTASESA